MSKKLAASMAAVTALALLPVAVTSVAGSAAAAPRATKISIHKVGTSAIPAAGTTDLELREGPAEDAATAVKAVANRSPRSQAKVLRTPAPLSGISPTQVLGTSAATAGWEGINHFQQRFVADEGNQWSLVPPDQALCVGNDQVVEAVNNAVQVYNTDGSKASDIVSVNELFWKDHEVVRAPVLTASPHQMGDPSCVYDAGSNRFFMTVYDLVSDSSGNPTGRSSVDIAVSDSGDATGTWSIYQLDTSNDGTNGTPKHPNCPCFGDYPHLGTDANGLYITTNEFSTLGDGFNGAMVYAIDKAKLVSRTTTAIPGAMFDTHARDLYQGVYYDGQTLAPALSAGTEYAPNTMYFLSSDSWSGDIPIVSEQILVWSITNTSALKTDPSSLRLDMKTVPVHAYFPPPASNQKKGSVPLADCLNITACAKVALGTPNRYKEYESTFDSSDTRMLQSAYANGKLWGALGTAVDVDGVTKAGVGYYVVDAATTTLTKQGVLGLSGENISYPALGVTAAGKAVMAVTLTGNTHYPSAAYVRLDDNPQHSAGAVRIAGAGVGPEDDFSDYRAFGSPTRPRFGDYGAAAVVGDTVWIASEYVAQTCTYSEFVGSNFRCGDTRTILANWSTHVTAVSTAG
jgi:hypothetical protein